MSINANTVRNLVMFFLAKHSADGKAGGLLAALQDVSKLRNSPNCPYDKKTVASAQEYLFARYHVVSGKYPALKVKRMACGYFPRLEAKIWLILGADDAATTRGSSAKSALNTVPLVDTNRFIFEAQPKSIPKASVSSGKNPGLSLGPDDFSTSATSRGEPVPGAEVFVEQEPNDEP